MKVFLYSRISTERQELTQQRNKVQHFLDSRGWSITEEVYDEGISGYKVSYKDRGLQKLLDKMEEGDCLICSELSRLGRKMFDINKLINDDLKPRKLRLVIVSMGIDLDCSKMKAIDELILQNFAFAAQVEAEMTRERTQSAIDVIKHEIATTGQHVAKKSGRIINKLGRPKGGVASEKTISASVNARKNTAKENPNNQSFMRFLNVWEQRNGRIDRNTDMQPFVDELNALSFRTATGMPFDISRARAMLYKVRKLYAS